jgi:hypothetical protein
MVSVGAGGRRIWVLKAIGVAELQPDANNKTIDKVTAPGEGWPIAGSGSILGGASAESVLSVGPGIGPRAIASS